MACFEMLPFYCAEAMIQSSRDAEKAANAARAAGYPDSMLYSFLDYSTAAQNSAKKAAEWHKLIIVEKGDVAHNGAKIDKAVKYL